MEPKNTSVSQPPKTPPKKKTMPSTDKVKCAIHKKEKVEFLCQEDKTKICGMCVPSHHGH